MRDQAQDNAADARRLKKRELDRKAQRLARERTKSRIAQLETMVENLRQTDSNAQISSLMDQLSTVTRERDELLQVLSSLGSTIRRHLDDATTTDRTLNTNAESSQQPMSMPVVQAPSQISRSSSETSGPTTAWEIPTVEHQPIDSLSNDAWSCSIPCVGPLAPAMVLENPILSQPSTDLIPLPGLLPSSPSTDDVIIPIPPMICFCTTPNSCASTHHGQRPKNIWRAANEALGRSTKLPPEEMVIEEFTCEDTPVRAVLEGWDSVEQAGKMTASWRKLRRVDEVCFKTCAKTERLAILRMMHLMMTYHGDPTVQRRASLPRWFWMRPSQVLAHSYAIDFFVWPGVRERFVFSQHQYCTNLFWDLFQANLKILWPYDFRDTYMQNAHTGKFYLSPLFEERIRDINSWTMSGDFFSQFPELYEDIPTYLGIPPPIGGISAVISLAAASQFCREDKNRNETIILGEKGA